MPDGSELRRATRIGLALFTVYLSFYALFVYMSAFHAEIMAHHGGAQVNVAVWFGFTLIVSPLLLALLYLWLCRARAPGDAGP